MKIIALKRGILWGGGVVLLCVVLAWQNSKLNPSDESHVSDGLESNLSSRKVTKVAVGRSKDGVERKRVEIIDDLRKQWFQIDDGLANRDQIENLAKKTIDRLGLSEELLDLHNDLIETGKSESRSAIRSAMLQLSKKPSEKDLADFLGIASSSLFSEKGFELSDFKDIVFEISKNSPDGTGIELVERMGSEGDPYSPWATLGYNSFLVGDSAQSVSAIASSVAVLENGGPFERSMKSAVGNQISKLSSETDFVSLEKLMRDKDKLNTSGGGGGLDKRLFSRWGDSNPNEAAQYIVTNVPNKGALTWVAERVIAKMHQQRDMEDSEKVIVANEFILMIPKGDFRDEAIRGFVNQTALSYPAMAESFVQQVDDSQLREVLTSKIKKMQELRNSGEKY